MASNSKKSESEKADPTQAGRDFALDIFNIVALLVLVGLFFYEVLVRGQIFFAGDIMNVYTPWQQYNQEALAAGRMPLWSDDFFMGFPLFAESQGALFYLPTRLVYSLVNPVRAFTYDVLLHFFMAGCFQYLFARTLRLSPAAAMLSAVAFAFSGMFLSLPINFTIFRSIVWIPLIFMFLTIGARRGSLLFPLFAALSMVFQMMGGSLQVTGITILALVPYAFFLMISPAQKKQASLLPLLQLVLTVILAAGLYAFQLLPTLELMHHAWRGTQGGYEVASAFSFPPEHFIDVIMPTFFGVWAEGSLLPARTAANFFPYIGLVPLLLLLPSLGVRKRGLPVMLILVVLFLMLAVGKYGLVYKAVYSTVPFFDKFRAPDRFWMIAVFAGSIMAGYGLERLVADSRSAKPKFSAGAAGLVGFIMLLLALLALGALYVPMVKTVWNGLIDSFFALFPAGMKAAIDPAVYSRWQSHLALILLHVFIVVTAFHFAVAMFAKKGRTSALAGSLVLITILDLYAISLQVPALHTTGKEYFTVPPRTAQVIARDGDPNRFYSFLKTQYAREVFNFPSGQDDTLWYNGGGSKRLDEFIQLREAMSPNIFMTWDLTSSNGFASLFLERYLNMEVDANQQLMTYLEGNDNHPPRWDDRPILVDLMASRYILSPLALTDTNRFSLVDGDGPVNVYRNHMALPRAWVARPQSVLAETPATLEQLIQGEFDPRDSLIIHPLPPQPRKFEGGAEGSASARIISASGADGALRRGGAVIDEQVLIEVSSPQPAYLILADTQYPGWTAEIDGAPIDRIYRAFGYFRAVEIPAGEHLVRFEYNPQSFLTGQTLSAVTIVTFLLLLIVQLLFFSKTAQKKKEE